MIKAIIFDCFGVVITDTLESAYSSLGGKFQEDLPEIRRILLASDKGEILSTYAELAELVRVTESTFSTAISSGREVNKELLEYINSKIKPDYKVAMLSNVGKGMLPQIFGRGFLEKYFDVIIASGDIGFAKPEARAYEIAADALSVRLDECIFIDDRIEYIEGAQHVGMKTILYENFGQLRTDLQRLIN